MRPFLSSPRRPGRPAKPRPVWFTVEEVARQFDCEPAYVAQACTPPSSFFPNSKPVRGSWIIPQTDLESQLHPGATLPPPLMKLERFAALVDSSKPALVKRILRGTLTGAKWYDGWRVPVSEYWRIVKFMPRTDTPRPAAPFSFSRSTGKGSK